MKKIILISTVFIFCWQFSYAQIRRVASSIVTNNFVTTDFGNALQFDGDDDYVNAGVRANLEMSDELTVEAWIYPTGEGSVDGGIVVNREGEYEVARRGGSIFVAIANSSPGWDWIYTGYFAPLNVWSHICFTYSASQQSFKFYANGEVTYSLFATGNIGDIGISKDLDEFWIGARQYDFGLPIKHQYFDGTIDEVRVWDKALSQSEIKGWMRKSVTSDHPEFSHLAGYWTFDEGKGATTLDASGHGNTGTLINSPKWVNSSVPVNTFTFYADNDQDGFGDVNVAIEDYSAPSGYVVNHTDCNDNNASVHPNAVEYCNGVDDNCNGQIDEDCIQLPAPTVKINSPVDGATYTANATVILSADATDKDGKVKTVSFYNGNNLIFTELSPPFYRKWFNVKEGDYIFTVKATDNNGLSTTSVPIHITVLPSTSPSVNIMSPLNESKLNAPADIFLRADAIVPNGTISKVEFYNGNDLVLTEYKAPYGNKWRNVPPGNYSFTAKVTDGDGNVITSQPVAVTVTGALSRMIVKEEKVVEPGKSLSLSVNPNPVANVLNISVEEANANSKSVISLISASGVLVKTLQLNALNKNMKLDVSSLSAGVYFIKVISDSKVLYSQFVKL